MPYYMLSGSSIWILVNFIVFKLRYPDHSATGADTDYHVIMTIVGLLFVAIISMMMDAYWLSELKQRTHPTSVVVITLIAFLGLIACVAIVVANLRFMTGMA